MAWWKKQADVEKGAGTDAADAGAAPLRGSIPGRFGEVIPDFGDERQASWNSMNTLKPKNFFRKFMRGSEHKTDASERPKTAEELEIARIEFVYRYSILSLRVKLLRHSVMEKAESDGQAVDVAISDTIQEDLARYTNALRDYSFWRAEAKHLFQTEQLGGIVTSQHVLDGLLQGAGTAAQDQDLIDELRKDITEDFRQVLLLTTSGLSDHKETSQRKALWARLSMALGGGLALIVPMLIMVLLPSRGGQVVILTTTSCFIVAVAIVLAVFMKDSQPKDVVACTVAYAAVLVVFVGAGGGS
ncbi:hypothetical protein B0H63DRAFT_504861 [Podospora didyma]|uniref:DUF6594 domain-containing protein n=1 Tax=Podospora didyma TaxID=330526 RepID=A0AAE0P3T6_9PEZI|nr:hypothetical protein B0H63DRAFT_504861 [Podospora didyma]